MTTFLIIERLFWSCKETLVFLGRRFSCRHQNSWRPTSRNISTCLWSRAARRTVGCGCGRGPRAERHSKTSNPSWTRSKRKTRSPWFRNNSYGVSSGFKILFLETIYSYYAFIYELEFFSMNYLAIYFVYVLWYSIFLNYLYNKDFDVIIRQRLKWTRHLHL